MGTLQAAEDETMERDAVVVRKGVSVRLEEDRPQPHEPIFKPLTKLIMHGIVRIIQMTKSLCFTLARCSLAISSNYSRLHILGSIQNAIRYGTK